MRKLLLTLLSTLIVSASFAQDVEPKTISLTDAERARGAEDQELPVSDIQDSGCTRVSDDNGEEDQTPTIVLEKEGNILSVQLLNYISNCGTEDFEVNPSIHEGDAGEASTLTVDVIPHQ